MNLFDYGAVAIYFLEFQCGIDTRPIFA